MERTKHICDCGNPAVCQEDMTGEWLCSRCAVVMILKDIENNKPVSVSLQHRNLLDVLLVPGDYGKGDLLARLEDSVHISFCRN